MNPSSAETPRRRSMRINVYKSLFCEHGDRVVYYESVHSDMFSFAPIEHVAIGQGDKWVDQRGNELSGEHLRLIQEYVATLPPIEEWQPIDTAPKDGTWIELFGLRYGEPRIHCGFWSEDDKDWFDGEAASGSLTAFEWQPTHWKPFAAPAGVVHD